MATTPPEPEQTPPARASRAEVAERVAEILRIRLDGAQFHDCVVYAAEKGWNVSERQVGRYVAAADDLLRERLDKKRGRVIARRIAQREALFARAVNAADYRAALAVLADLDKLQGHYPEKDLRELVKLAAAQGQRIEELERKLALAGGQTSGDVPPTG